MSLIPWLNKKTDPVTSPSATPMTALRHEIDRLFDSFSRDPFAAIQWPFGQRGFNPVVDMTESEQEVVVRAEMPGLKPEEIDVSLAGNQLVISGEKRESSEKQESGALYAECSYGTFRRMLSLPEGVDTEDVSADYTNGVLTIKLKKTKAAQAKRISVKSEVQ